MSKISSPFNTSAFSNTSGFGSTLAISPISHVGEPLDLSVISDSSLQILFKNLSKKEHENTKVKALEELSNCIGSSQDKEIDEGILSAWIQLYPRLSVDASRRVRQLTYNLHGIICSGNKKKIAKFMPQIIGPWLCGTYDNDRTVVKAARESLTKTFTLEKLKKVWEVYHSNILTYCTNVIEREQIYTLSSETQGKNAEEAEAKFARVIGACISALRHILMDVPLETLTKEDASYRDFFSKPRVWEFAYNTDPSVRGAVYNLLRACLKRHQGYLEENLSLISKNVLSKSIDVSQIGSVSEYLETLIQLTGVYPDIWSQLKGKKGNKTLTLLSQFISKGPQGAQPDFWVKFNQLFDLIPEEVIPQDRQSIEDLLDAFVHGINGLTVSKTHAVLSWTSYFGVCCKFLSLKGLPEDIKQMIVDSRVIPIYEDYLLDKDSPTFRVTGPLAITACVNGLLKLSPEKNIAITDRTNPTSHADELEESFKSVWDKLEAIVFSKVKIVETPSDLSPETFPVGSRWLELLSEFNKLLPEDSINARKLSQSNRTLVRVCLENLERYKAPVVASLFEKALATSPPSVWSDPDLRIATEDFFSVQLPSLHPSPLAAVVFKAMLQWLRYTNSKDTIEALWTENISALLSSQEDSKGETIAVIFSDFPSELNGKVPLMPELVAYVMGIAEKAVVDDDDEAWSLTTAALQTQGVLIPESTVDKILEIIADRITAVSPHDVDDAGLLVKLEFLAINHMHSLVNFIKNSPCGTKLLFNLLRLEGFTVGLDSNTVKRISKSIEIEIQMPSSTQDALDLKFSMARIIRQAVFSQNEYDGNQIPVDFLVSKALQSFHHAHEEERPSMVDALLFPDEEWSIQNARGQLPLSSFLSILPTTGVDLANPLGGCVFLILHNEKSSIEDFGLNKNTTYQALLRVAVYTFKLIQDTTIFECLNKDTRILSYLKLLLVVEVTKDKMPGIEPYLGIERLKFTSDVQSFMAERLRTHHGFFDETGHSEIDILGQKLMELSRGGSATAFYAARVLYWILSELVEINHCSQNTAENFLEKLGVRNTEDIFQAVAILLALSTPLTGSKLTDKLLNSLASDVSSIAHDQIPRYIAPPKLILLNTLMPKPNEGQLTIPQQRAMFLLRSTLEWFKLDEQLDTDANSAVNEALVSETAKLLRSLAPAVKDLYGSHWRHLCRLVLMGWKHSSRMTPMTYWCMKLYEELKRSHTSNDDFDEAFNEHRKQFHELLIQLFQSSHSNIEDPSENICYILLVRLVKQIPIDEFSSMDEIYPLLGGMLRPIQETAYEILNQYIPLQQEQISIEVALAREDDDFAPQLAPELLSLVLDTPTAEKLEDLIFDGNLAGEFTEEPIRSFSLAWRLIFKHFEKATFKVKSAYTANLQEGGYIDKLLDLVFEFLGITRGRSFDPSRDLIKHFPVDEEDWTSEKSIKQLLVHIYYLLLLNTPSLAKNWFSAQTNRQTRTGVEDFTKKYLSPLIIDAELTSVSSWAVSELPSSASALGSSSTDIEIQVRVSRSVREVTITCPVDDQVMELMIRLPPAFPLTKPEIEGVKKVGFTESQWKALRLASHAVIALQGGSIIDAVMLFRKNVSLHFAGVEECAICYSIVGQERTLPEKKCATCSNKFHSGCLFKWFRTSNSSTCPLCRSGWQFYGKANH